MSVPPELFDEDYIHFYAETLGDERSGADAELIVRLLSLRPGMRVLDVPCGEGRITGRLGQHGCDVVGLDSSRLLLARASDRWPDLRFELGDMRRLLYDGEFDALVNWFTSFGYFDRETNDLVLAGFARALRPGGRLLLDIHNPGHLAELMRLSGGRAGVVSERDGDLMVDRVSYDASDGYSLTERFIVRGGQVRKLEFRLEQVPAPQLVERLQRAGFGAVRVLGRGGGPFVPDGPRLIALAERRETGPSAGPAAGLVVRVAERTEREWIAECLRERWGSTEIVSRGRSHDARELPALICLLGDTPVGVATYRLADDQCELVTLDALLERHGVGSALLGHLAALARHEGCRRLWLITTNDNLSALRFYQRRGMRLVAVHRDAVERAREIKPEIPVYGDGGIPITDELELELPL
jgi:SAM-dependent methyltransferase